MSTTCSAAEIAEKKRLALEKLRAKKLELSNSQIAKSDTHQVSGNKPAPQLHSNVSKSINLTTTSTSSRENSSFKIAPGNFYPQTPASNNQTRIDVSPKSNPSGSTQAFSGENRAAAFYSALRQSNLFPYRKDARNSTHPYMRPTETAANLSSAPSNQPNYNNKNNPSVSQVAPIFLKPVTCKVYMISQERFAVEPSSYHEKLIEVFKTVPSKYYVSTTRKWNFALSDYEKLQESVSPLKPQVVFGVIPQSIISLCRKPPKPIDPSCLASIEETLAEKLMPFQQEGVCFVIAQHGRAMICDEMGLGKTYQALAVADFYRENWPLLICTTATMREHWASKVRELLPSVPLHYIHLLTNQQHYVGDAKILISSYNMMERVASKLTERKFGVIIFDESHTLKNSKAKCTIMADRLALMAKNVILLSGTPALSRPLELFTQLQLVDRKFMNFKEYTARYCDGKQTHFGWDATGESNMEELKVLLKLKYMIRRLKVEVLPELTGKARETVLLDPTLIWPNESTKETLSLYAKDFLASKGKEKEEILLKYYAETANVKARAVCAYLKTILEDDNVKFIVFAHHRVMLDAITQCLIESKVKFIRIDGSTKSDHRAEYIDKFQKKSSCRVALLSLKACNTGITLTAADMIIFAELDWNPSTLAQAESRAHRIGQDKPVVCRYLMANKTADDVIWNMLKSKQDILNRAGLFAENLQQAKHTVAPISTKQIDSYLEPMENEQKSSESATKNTEPNSNENLENLDEVFGDIDDDDFKDLNF